jgi:two-component system aerobic respiration control sensor histidine kinase ArcB
MVNLNKYDLQVQLLELFTEKLNINYFVIDTSGKRIVKNSVLAAIKENDELTPLAWETCQEVMAKRKTLVFQEEFNGRWFMSIKAPLYDKKGDIAGVIGIAVDITEQKQAELAKEEFLANMAHDLRTPFSGILSMTSLVYEQETDPFKRSCLAQSIASSKQLLKLLNDILELSSLSHYAPDNAVFNIKEETSAIIEMMQAEASSKGIHLSLICPDADICTDKARLLRILLNLIGNAVKFTERGSVDILLTLISDKLFLEVKDTGVGIAQKHIEHIFEKFYKVTASYRGQVYKGLGLGLHITKQSIEELGGTITVQSRLGEGTTFSCVIPLLKNPTPR